MRSLPHASLTRRITFAAAHRYRRPEWSDEKNLEVFGSCSRPSYHGHNYACEITVSGEIDRETGFLIDLGALDAIIREEVIDRFDHRNINADVAEFGDGKLVPSGENLAMFIFARVQERLAGRATVTSVKVAEDDTLSATYTGE